MPEGKGPPERVALPLRPHLRATPRRRRPRPTPMKKQSLAMPRQWCSPRLLTLSSALAFHGQHQLNTPRLGKRLRFQSLPPVDQQYIEPSRHHP